MLSIINIPDVKKKLAARFKERRLSFNFTQSTLAEKSGVSLGSVKRFEKDCEISLSNLLKLSLVLECLEDFTQICSSEYANISSMDELLEQTTQRKRGQQ